MAKAKDETEIPGVPSLDVSPPTEPVTVLSGPQPEESQPDGEPKKRRRRKKAQPETPVEGGASEQDLETCQAALTTTFAIASKVAAKHRGEHWALSDSEAESLGQVWTAALAPYLPKIGAAIPWATALIVTATMILPRVERDRELAALPNDGPANPPPELVR